MALISKASLLMVPSTYEEGTLYNVLPSGNRAPDSTDQNSGYDQTRADFTFDRGSNAAATRIGSDGLIKKYRENIFLYSQDFSQSNWQVLNATKVSTNETDPNGGLTACNITWAAGAGTKFLFQNVSSGNLLCLSMYVKSNGGGNKFRLFGDGATDFSQDFTATDEWQRFEFFFERGSGLGTGIASASDSSSADLLVAFAQVETSMVATDYLDSGATTGKAGVLIDLPRINYDANGENGALLLEPSRQQLIQYSEYISGWTASGLTISENQTTSPEGVQNAAKLALPSGSAIKRIALGSMPTTAVARSYSFFVKSDDIAAIQLLHSGDLQGYARFDISSGVVGSKGSKTTSDIEDYGNGWYRCTANFDATNSFGSTIYLYINDSGTGGYGGSTSEQGDLFVWGGQYEAGSYATSYIPNMGESGGVTRAADSCNGGGSAESINSTEGVLYAEISALADDGTYRIFSINDGTTNERVYIQYTNASNAIAVVVKNGGTTQANISHSLTDETQNTKVAFRYKANDFAFYVNGSQIGTDTSGSTPVGLNNFSFDQGNGANPFYGNVKQVAVFNEALSDSELATLTTL